jgi:polyphosphate kinase 2 (PPK2 family)
VTRGDIAMATSHAYDGQPVGLFRDGKISNKDYEAELFKLHTELVKLQYWVKEKGLRVVVVFEGRGAAGKGGVIKRLTERVMEFCSEKQYEDFLKYTPIFERSTVDAGIHPIKYWFDVRMAEQGRRFQARMEDPRKVWKLSPMDVESYDRWYVYSRARDDMLAATSTDYAPWHLVRADVKKRARLNRISHFLS